MNEIDKEQLFSILDKSKKNADPYMIINEKTHRK